MLIRRWNWVSINPPRIALLDACVLYSAPVRDLLMQMAVSHLFQARWTERIQIEWQRSLLRARPDIQAAQLRFTEEQMITAIPDAEIKGFEETEGRLTLPDPDDRHVLAAAIDGRCDVIITFNLSDFPPGTTLPLGIEVMHPDEFLLNLLGEAPKEALAAARACHARLVRRQVTRDEHLASLVRSGLRHFVDALRRSSEWP